MRIHRVKTQHLPGAMLPGGTWCSFCNAELCKKQFSHYAIDIKDIKKAIELCTHRNKDNKDIIIIEELLQELGINDNEKTMG